jgi:hypothetical protein
VVITIADAFAVEIDHGVAELALDQGCILFPNSSDPLPQRDIAAVTILHQYRAGRLSRLLSDRPSFPQQTYRRKEQPCPK